MRLNGIIALTLLLIKLETSGQSFNVGNITTTGTGCPSSSAHSIMSPDNSAVSILFDAYSARVGGSSPLNVAILDCKISVPVQLPAGTSVMLDSLDYRGFASLPPSGTMLFGTRDGFHSSNASHEDPADRVTRIIGSYQDNFILQRKRPVQIWSRCGDHVELMSYSRLLIRTNGQRQETIASIDSADGAFSVQFNLITRSCANGDPGTQTPGPGRPPPGIRPMPGSPGQWPR